MTENVSMAPLALKKHAARESNRPIWNLDSLQRFFASQCRRLPFPAGLTLPVFRLAFSMQADGPLPVPPIAAKSVELNPHRDKFTSASQTFTRD